MIVFTLFLLVLMLIVSGMAVDFMRFESRRAELQGVVDRAVLAAADLDQTTAAEAKDVVIDYFTKAGMLDQLKGDPIVTPGTDYREVTANGELKLNTYFLKLIGMDTLTAAATSTAIEGVGNIEISLVLDISGSMRYDLVSVDINDQPDGGPAPTMVDPVTGQTRTVRRIDRLQEAAGNFVTTLLSEANEDKVSISLVPYSEHVNPGEDIFNRLSTVRNHGYSHCVEFPASAYDSTTFDFGTTYQQVQHVQMNPHWNGSDWDYSDGTITMPVCPHNDYETITPLSQNATALVDQIEDLQPRAGTSIFLGLKWGATLLDPSFRGAIQNLPSGTIDSAFANRPADYPGPNTTGDTRKYIVLMTDGQNDWSDRLHDNVYDTPSEIAHWASMNEPYFRGTYTGWDSSSNWRYRNYTAAIGDQYMAAMCDAVRDRGIILFAISLGSSSDPVADQRGWDMMRSCATTENLFYKTSGSELVAIFEDIAEQITDLRLTQ